mmetsp:Transcript_26900/g.57027  ORF Transcript_26900/g.57027 Transcript_26900/m.57027 type:complete len:156 (-) Transcript_26900:1648-2115(-)
MLGSFDQLWYRQSHWGPQCRESVSKRHQGWAGGVEAAVSALALGLLLSSLLPSLPFVPSSAASGFLVLPASPDLGEAGGAIEVPVGVISHAPPTTMLSRLQYSSMSGAGLSSTIVTRDVGLFKARRRPWRTAARRLPGTWGEALRARCRPQRICA